MKLICGLGNPGREYERNRHNIGFRVVETLASRARAPAFQDKFDGLFAQGQLGGEKVLFLLPQTFMNLSGRSVGPAMRFYKVGVEDLLVIHDEIEVGNRVIARNCPKMNAPITIRNTMLVVRMVS